MKRWGVLALVVCVTMAFLFTFNPGSALARQDEAAVKKGAAALRALYAAILMAVMTDLNKNGAPSAVSLCHDQATAITEKVAKEQGVTLGRTSHKIRDPANANPPEWTKKMVAEGAGKKTKELEKQYVVDLGDRVGVMQPFDTILLCTNCHGTADTVAPETKAALAEFYPDDQATGFEVGDVRGWMWAEVPK